ncbi:MAG: hypothetical protein KGZ25_14985, partial [Planctomycetes bacterium]|nr:hypothetical protein [Planctomycetota bacterium]
GRIKQALNTICRQSGLFWQVRRNAIYMERQRHIARPDSSDVKKLPKRIQEKLNREFPDIIPRGCSRKDIEIAMKCKKITTEMENQGKRIPGTFKEMLNFYNAKLFNPPLIFDVEEKPDGYKKTEWKYGFRQAIYHEWKKRGFGVLTPKKVGGDIKVLATIDRQVEGKTIRFVFWHARNFRDLGIEQIITGMYPIVMQENGTWKLQRGWSSYPGIVLSAGTQRCSVSYNQNVYIGDFFSGDCKVKDALWAADLPAPFDRPYKGWEFKEF